MEAPWNDEQLKINYKSGVMIAGEAWRMLDAGESLEAVNDYLRGNLRAIDSFAETWEVVPERAKKFLAKSVNRSAFLQKVKHFYKTKLLGEITTYSVGRVLKRTEITDTQDRGPNITSNTEKRTWQLEDYEADTFFSYEDLENFFEDSSIPQEVRNVIEQAIANDILFCGFNGVDNLATTTLDTLHRLFKGWLQKARENDAANAALNAAEPDPTKHIPMRVMTEGVSGSGAIFVGETRVRDIPAGPVTSPMPEVVGIKFPHHGFQIGANLEIAGTKNYDGKHIILGTSTASEIHIAEAYTAEDIPPNSATLTHHPDYTNIDALAVDMKNGIQKHLRKDLVVIYSDEMHGDEEEALFETYGGTPTEKLAIGRALNQIGRIPSINPDYFPEKTMVVTNLQNLAVYHYKKEMRKSWKEAENKKGYISWMLGKLTFEILDYDQFSMAENILPLSNK